MLQARREYGRHTAPSSKFDGASINAYLPWQYATTILRSAVIIIGRYLIVPGFTRRAVPIVRPEMGVGLFANAST